MKIIDLLNKIANGVTYTKKARIRYFDRKNDYKDECILNEVAIGYRLYNQNIELNDEVEIIKEEKKIPEKLIPTALKGIDNLDEKIEIAHIDTISAIETINEILDYLKSKGE